MKVIGIIAEYNPFHLGHAYQLQKAHELFGEDTAIVAVMSGSFVQRGEPAIASKWTRAQAALQCGVDLVIEIPFTYACASAERFAQGAVGLLQATGIVTDLYFGSEFIDLSLLNILAGILSDESLPYTLLLKAGLKDGHSYAKARELALTAYLVAIGNSEIAEKCAALLKMPNTILALEYLIALKKSGSGIKPSVLLRYGAGYHDISMTNENASASAIRNTVTKSVVKGVFSVSQLAGQLAGKMPPESLSPLLSEWSNGIRPVLASDFIPETILALRSRTTAQLDGLAYMGDQVSHRLKNAVAGLRNCSKEDLPESFRALSDTKRYAGTRINRALISLLLGQTAADLASLSSPEYLRILGFSERGRYLLRLMKKTASLPQIDKASDFLEYGQNEKLSRMAELDLLSTDLWGLKAGYIYGDEYERSVIRIKGKVVIK
ncbi:MAG: nucleotidyltransferase family protein [Eubacteriales bacterium]